MGYLPRNLHPAKAANTQAHDVYCSMEVGETTYGQMPLDAIRPMNCLRVLQLRRAMVAANPLRKAPAIVSEGTVQRDRRLLQAIFERAVENDHIARNPWKGIESKPVRLGVKAALRARHHDDQRAFTLPHTK